MEPFESLALGVAVGLLLMIVLTAVAFRMYADAVARGDDGEAGFWGFLALGF
jgi:hypothetical protein